MTRKRVVWVGGRSELPELSATVKWVQLQSAGIEPWVERVRATPDVQFTSAAGAYATQVAEHALALLIAGMRGIYRYARACRGTRGTSGRWRARRSRSSAPAGSAGR